MNYKKLLATAVFTLGVWMSAGAMAQTNYNFSLGYFLDWDGPDTGAYVWGTATGDGLNLSNFVLTNFTSTNGINYAITAYNISSPMTDTLYSLTPSYYGRGIDSYSHQGVTRVPFTFTANSQSYNSFFTTYRGLPALTLTGDGLPSGLYRTGSTIFTQAAAVPEMDGSLIPQVGLLLGCLFFLFGRKKEVVEPMMTA